MKAKENNFLFSEYSNIRRIWFKELNKKACLPAGRKVPDES